MVVSISVSIVAPLERAAGAVERDRNYARRKCVEFALKGTEIGDITREFVMLQSDQTDPAACRVVGM
jgi:hypothetical protein